MDIQWDDGNSLNNSNSSDERISHNGGLMIGQSHGADILLDDSLFTPDSTPPESTCNAHIFDTSQVQEEIVFSDAFAANAERSPDFDDFEHHASDTVGSYIEKGVIDGWIEIPSQPVDELSAPADITSQGRWPEVELAMLESSQDCRDTAPTEEGMDAGLEGTGVHIDTSQVYPYLEPPASSPPPSSSPPWVFSSPAVSPSSQVSTASSMDGDVDELKDDFEELEETQTLRGTHGSEDPWAEDEGHSQVVEMRYEDNFDCQIYEENEDELEPEEYQSESERSESASQVDMILDASCEGTDVYEGPTMTPGIEVAAMEARLGRHLGHTQDQLPSQNNGLGGEETMSMSAEEGTHNLHQQESAGVKFQEPCPASGFTSSAHRPSRSPNVLQDLPIPSPTPNGDTQGEIASNVQHNTDIRLTEDTCNPIASVQCHKSTDTGDHIEYTTAQASGESPVQELDIDAIIEAPRNALVGSKGGPPLKLETENIVQSTKTTELPNPRRPTHALQRRQHDKLTKPFRSPFQIPFKGSNGLSTPPVAKHEPPVDAIKVPEKNPFLPAFRTITMAKHRTVRAASQFKSPLSAGASSQVLPSVRMTPKIQFLERKIQLLKRAIKIQEDGGEEALEDLAKKWKEAAREVAWEVWDLVKDRTQEKTSKSWGYDEEEKGKKRGFDESWGWEGQGESKIRGFGDDGGGPSCVGDEVDSGDKDMRDLTMADGDDECNQETLGTMLKQLRIAPDTLGWSEDEATFVDE